MSVQITRTITEHVNLGSYEWAEYSATATFDASAGVSDEFIAALDATLDRLVARERDRYAALTTEDHSFIHDHPALPQEH